MGWERIQNTGKFRQDMKNIGYLGQILIKDNPELRSKDENRIFCNRESSG